MFFSSMFVTNDVSLLIFVPLTILLFRNAGKERYILPVISMENIAAIRNSIFTCVSIRGRGGSLLKPLRW